MLGRLGRCDFVLIQGEAINIGDTVSDWRKTFRIRGLGRPRQGFLIFNVKHLTYEEVPVSINGREIGKIYPLGSWEEFQRGWFTQMISIDSGILCKGDNKIYVKAMELPDDTENKYDDFDLKEVICFFR